MAGISIGGGFSVGRGLSGGSGLSAGSGTYFPGFSSTTLNLNFTAAPLDSRLTLTATSLATMYDSSGYITFRPNNLLVDSGLTTVDTVSGNDKWYNSYAATMTATPNAGVAPDGTSTALLLQCTGPTSFNAITQRTAETGPYNYIYSVYAKAASTDTQCRIFISDTTSLAAYTYGLFSLSGAGSVNTTTVGTTVTSRGSTISSVGNGWYLCTIAVSISGSPVNITTLMYPGTAGAQTANSATLFWHPQLEAVTYETTPRTYNATTGSAYYGPRFDYNPAHGQSGALLLLELARSNTVNNSSNLSTGTWTLGNATRTLSAVLGPDNDTAAYYVTATADNGWIRVIPTGGSSILRVGSVFLRRKTGTGAVRIGAGNASYYVNCTNIPTNGWQRYQVDLFGQTGTYTATTTVVTVTLTAHGYNTGDRVRTSVSSGSAASVTTGDITVIDANTFTYAQSNSVTNGDIVVYPSVFRIMFDTNGDEVYVWGAQFEIGGRGATSYVPTAGVAVTRAADTIAATGTNFSSWFTFNGSVTCEFVQGTTFGTSASGTLLSISNGTTSWSTFFNNSTTGLFVSSAGTSGGTASLAPSGLSNGVLYKAGASITPGSPNTVIRSKLSGQSLFTNSSVVGVPTPDRMYFNLSANSASAGAFWLKSFTFYNRPLTAAELGVLVP